ncbi:hypothetical protein FACS189476_06510 [Spirochaetia bacterium]|nr:hypothetical protein FACS189476_06510 [Spirochaetia bacterium]
MKPYDEYKATNYDWLPQIPAHWKWVYLSQTCKEQCVKNTKRNVNTVLSLSYGNIIRKKNINFGLVPEDYAGYQIVGDGNIILRLTDLQNDHTSLRTGLVKETGIITSAYTCLKPFENPTYLQLLLHSYDCQKVFYGMGGGVRQSIGFKDIRNTCVPLPPRAEQDQIVRYLDWKVSMIDTYIKAKKKQIELFKEEIDFLSNSMINEPEKRVRLKYIVDNIRNWIVRNDDTLYSPVGVLNRGRGIFYKALLQGVDLGDSDFFTVESHALMISGQFAWEGAVALTTENENGCIASHRYYTVRGKNGVCETEYLWAFFQTKLGDSMLNQCSHGAAGRNRPLNFIELLNEYIPIPSLEQQHLVACKVRLYMKYREAVKKFELFLQEYRTRFISDVVTGKVDVYGVKVPEFEPIEETADKGEALDGDAITEDDEN